jgi:anti-anti-sigma factor
MDFKVSTSSIDNDGLLIWVEGEFDLSTAKQVQRPAEMAVATRRPVLLDLSKCAFMDSTALRLVLKIHNDLVSRDGSSAPMAVVASSAVRKFFSITGIDQAVPVFLNHGQALESIGASRSHINAAKAEGGPESVLDAPNTGAEEAA